MKTVYCVYDFYHDKDYSIYALDASNPLKLHNHQNKFINAFHSEKEAKDYKEYLDNTINALNDENKIKEFKDALEIAAYVKELDYPLTEDEQKILDKSISLFPELFV